VLIRLTCLAFAAGIAWAGISESSIALIALATAIVGLALAGIGGTGPSGECRARTTAAQKRPVLTPELKSLGGAVVGLSVFAAALGGSSSRWLMALAIVAWVLSFVALVALGLALDGLASDDLRSVGRSLIAAQNRPELASVAAITLVALVLRAYQLETLPAAVHTDEGELGRMALAILNGDQIPFFKSAPFTHPVEYVQAFFISLFGPTVAGLRMASVVAGVICIPIVYGIGRVGWGPLAGATAAWLMAVSHLAIHYSRLAQVFMLSTTLTAAAMLLLALAAEQARRRVASLEQPPDATPSDGRTAVWTLLLAAGAITGLGLSIYLATRIVPMIAGVLLLYLLWLRRIGPWHIAAYVFATAATYAPMAVFYLDSPVDFYARTNTISAFQDWYVREVLGPNASLPSALPALLLEQTRRTLGLFVTTGDFSGFYSSSLTSFDPVTAAMIWLGFGLALTRIRRYHELALVLWAVVSLVLGSIVILGARNDTAS
jgi:4-amino-4-deoxy-L-arabinose transferase-like glycosyltransferase